MSLRGIPFFVSFAVCAGLSVCIASIAHSAEIACELQIGLQTVASQRHGIMNENDRASHDFRLVLEGQSVRATLRVQSTRMMISLLNTETGDERSGLTEWIAPLEQKFLTEQKWIIRGTSTDVIFRCDIDVSDGESWNWRLYRAELDLDLQSMRYYLNEIREAAAQKTATPAEEISANAGICMSIGQVIEGRALQDLAVKTIDLDVRYNYRFPGLYDLFFYQIYGPIFEIQGFCGKGEGTLAQGDRAALMNRVEFYSKGLSEYQTQIERGYQERSREKIPN